MNITTVEGMITEIIYYNEDNFYTVFALEVDQNDRDSLIDESEVVCVATLPNITEGEYVKIQGKYHMHPSYGLQIKVESYERLIPTTENGIERYLASGIIKGIGKKTAKLIVNEFGKDTFNIIENEPEKLAKIKGISINKAMNIAETFSQMSQLRQITMFLQQYGISATYCVKIYNQFKERTIDVVKTNPYLIANEVIGIGFIKADEIAQKVGIDKDSEYRIRAAVKYVLNQAIINGHVFLPFTLLKDKTLDLLKIHTDVIDNIIVKMNMDNEIHMEKRDGYVAVYLNSYYYAESYVANKLSILSNAIIDEIDVKIDDDKLCHEQKMAVEKVLKKGVVVITGGPGTGKTTTIKTIIDIMDLTYNNVILTAPTGRAAKRMTEATGFEAKTIHRLLGASYNSENGSHRQYFEMCEDNPIEADVIIIDEMSMVDIMLMHHLLKAVAVGTRLVLVGDCDQLPSVGAGNVLKDIIKSGKIDVVKLTKIFRQDKMSDIILNAHNINKGIYPEVNKKDTDFFLVRTNSEDATLNMVINLTTNNLPKYIKSESVRDIQVLSPMKKGILGVQSLNEKLRDKLNPKDSLKEEKKIRDTFFRKGDRVMQIKNNYEISYKIYSEEGKLIDEGTGVFNGDTGTITEINNSLDYIEVLFDDNKSVRYDFSNLDELELSYAVTIHKSQGSEYRAVVMPIYSAPQVLMTRNLLYTAVTRAKELVVLVGSFENVKKMVDNNRELDRYTCLDMRLIEMDKLYGSN